MPVLPPCGLLGLCEAVIEPVAYGVLDGQPVANRRHSVLGVPEQLAELGSRLRLRAPVGVLADSLARGVVPEGDNDGPALAALVPVQGALAVRPLGHQLTCRAQVIGSTVSSGNRPMYTCSA